MLEDMKRKYARMLVQVGMNVQKGQSVLIEAAIEIWQFANLVAEEAYAAGAATVQINYIDLHKMKIDALNRAPEEVARYEEWEGARVRARMDEGACTIRLESEYPSLMRDLPDDKAHAVFSHIDGLRNIMRFKMRDNKTQWCIAAVPNQEWAEAVMPGEDKGSVLEKYWDILFRLCHVTEDNDPVTAWKAKRDRHAQLADKLDALNLGSLHFTSGNGTDLTIGLGALSRFGMPEEYKKELATRVSFAANIPTEEHCTTPLKYKTSGIVYSTKPLLMGGKMVRNFSIRFEGGKVVEARAEEGEDMLKAVIGTDAGSCYLGEVALVPYHSPISESGLVYYTTLIDENASCHLAFGRGLGTPKDYEEDGVRNPYNDSSIHIDFMFGAPDTDIVGTTRDGKQVQIFKNGDFAI